MAVDDSVDEVEKRLHSSEDENEKLSTKKRLRDSEAQNVELLARIAVLEAQAKAAAAVGASCSLSE